MHRSHRRRRQDKGEYSIKSLKKNWKKTEALNFSQFVEAQKCEKKPRIVMTIHPEDFNTPLKYCGVLRYLAIHAISLDK